MQVLPTRRQVMEALFRQWNPTSRTESIPLDSALGRVPVRDLYARLSVPVVRASAMDGVAVRSAAFSGGIPDTSGWTAGTDFVRADTGDDFDDRFDAVIPIEQAAVLPDGGLSLAPGVSVTAGMNVRPEGSSIREGELLARKNRELRAFDLACLAMGGVTQAEVYQRPRVAFLPTGNELVPLGAAVTRGRTIDSNSVLVRHMLREMGAEPVCCPIVPDDRGALSAALDGALQGADAVLLNGGSSKGEEDYTARLLEERGTALFHWVAAAPGKPMCVALIDGVPVINLPGPPLAVLYGMDWCVRALVCRLLHRPMPRRQTVKCVLTEDIRAPKDMEILCMMELRRTAAGYEGRQKPWRGGSLPDALGAGAVYVTRLGLEGHRAGEILDVELLRGEEDF